MRVTNGRHGQWCSWSWVAGAAIMLLAGTAAAADQTGSAVDSTAAQTVSELHHINQAEINAGKMAEDKGQAQAVKEYGKELERDHKAADDMLTSYAKQNKIDTNATTPAFQQKMAHMQSEMQQLQSLSGTEFDHRFLTAMAMDHSDAVKMVQHARKSVTDPQLKVMLGMLEPTLKAHREQAQNLTATLNTVSGNEQGAGGKSSAQGRRGTAGRIHR